VEDEGEFSKHFLDKKTNGLKMLDHFAILLLGVSEACGGSPD